MIWIAVLTVTLAPWDWPAYDLFRWRLRAIRVLVLGELVIGAIGIALVIGDAILNTIAERAGAHNHWTWAAWDAGGAIAISSWI